MILPTFELEDSFGAHIVAGIDEAGRGALCGPVFSACVVIVDKNSIPAGINDSKKIPERYREKIFDQIVKLQEEKKILFGIGTAEAEEIDRINILNATKLSMQRAYNNLLQSHQVKIDLVLVDGNFVPTIDTRTQYIIKGDQKSLSIATASIVAKVSRDRLLRKIHSDFAQYDWIHNKGYGTKKHLEAIKKYGLCRYHRETFCNIKQAN